MTLPLPRLQNATAPSTKVKTTWVPTDALWTVNAVVTAPAHSGTGAREHPTVERLQPDYLI